MLLSIVDFEVKALRRLKIINSELIKIMKLNYMLIKRTSSGQRFDEAAHVVYLCVFSAPVSWPRQQYMKIISNTIDELMMQV